ncbi:MAG: periplasmic heavy metal sensor [Scytolyngbya sp. HA4215-MV1]|nr:periplasmic heavy metal sensor [Scytolyngbya sp. HA4215-MV1]
MKLRYSLLFSVALLAIQVGSSIASAQSPLPDPAQTPPTTQNEIPVPPWARDLNLSAEQRSRLNTVHEQARQQGEPLQQKLMAAETQLQALLQSNASIEQLRQQHRVVQQLRQQLDDNHFEALLGERQVLTPEQLAKVIQMFRNRP